MRALQTRRDIKDGRGLLTKENNVNARRGEKRKQVQRVDSATRTMDPLPAPLLRRGIRRPPFICNKCCIISSPISQVKKETTDLKIREMYNKHDCFGCIH